MADIISITAEQLLEALKAAPADVEVEIYKFDDGSFSIPMKLGTVKAGRYRLEPKGDVNAIIAGVR